MHPTRSVDVNSKNLNISSLTSGLETQGPPDRLHPVDYMRYISLSVSLSRDKADWKVREVIVYTCCISLFVSLSRDWADWRRLRKVIVYMCHINRADFLRGDTE